MKYNIAKFTDPTLTAMNTKSTFKVISSRRKWLLLVLLCTLIGLFNTSIIITDRIANREPVKIRYPFLFEMTGAYGFLLLLPILLWFFGRFPIERINLSSRLGLHALAFLAFGFCLTMWMWGSRTLLFRLLGWGRYDYGFMPSRFLMEYQKQFLIYCLTYSAFFLVRYYRGIQAQKIKTSRLREELTRARLQALQMQLNPHFLFNTLNMISSTMYEDVLAADQMIANLSNLLRVTLTMNSRTSLEYTLEKEVEALSLYFEIMKARFQDKIAFHLDIGRETQIALIPPFLLQPLVENSIKHGLKVREMLEITISSHRENELLKLTVTDNGPGLHEDFQTAINQGFGLANVAERLQAFYGEDHDFYMENIQGGGLQVGIVVPYRLVLI